MLTSYPNATFLPVISTLPGMSPFLTFRVLFLPQASNSLSRTPDTLSQEYQVRIYTFHNLAHLKYI
jgi:hypothetical protein